MKNTPRKTETSVVIVVIIFPLVKTLGPTLAFEESFLEGRERYIEGEGEGNLLIRLDTWVTALRN